MNRNRHVGGRDRGGRSYGGGDGLLGEGPGMGGGLFEPINSQVNQLMLAQQLLQQQAVLGGAGNFGGGGGDYGLGNYGGIGHLGNMHYLQQQGMGYGGMGGIRNDRKRVGGQGRDMDFKRRRHNSSGRGGDRDRSRGRDSNRSSESRDINRSSRDSEKNKEKNHANKSKDDSDPAEEEEGKDKDKEKDKEGNLYCHVCNVSVYDEDSFRRHLNGTKHAQRMNSLLTVHQLKSNQLKSRLQAEEHLRKIEGKNGGVDADYFCKICNNSLTIPWERHRFSNIHKQRQLQVKRGCGWCNVHDFTNFTEVLEHRETDEHKKNAELYGKKRDDSDRSRSGSRERRSGKHEDDDEDLTIPEYNPENPVGVNYVIPVTGFFCKLCHKFYNNEKSAKGSHCQSEAHYDKFKLAIEAKQEAREKRLAEEAAAAAALKEKADEEKEKGNDQEMEEENEDTEDRHLGKNGEEHEDYDDDLPLEDEDNDGGLMDETAGLGKDTTSDSILNDTSANSSFVFLSGDMAQAQLKLQQQEEELLLQKSEDSDENTHFSDARDTSMHISGGEEDKDESFTASVSDEDSAPASTPGKSPAKAKGGGTAKRGRGKGKARK